MHWWVENQTMKEQILQNSFIILEQQVIITFLAGYNVYSCYTFKMFLHQGKQLFQLKFAAHLSINHNTEFLKRPSQG